MKVNGSGGFLLLCFAACAPLRPGPFQTFQLSVLQANKGLETEMARDVDWTREADVDILSSKKDASLSVYMLNETSGYSWKTKVVVPHWDARQTMKVLEELNAAVQKYAQLLTQTVQGDPAKDQQKKDLALSIYESMQAVKKLSPSGSAKNDIIFSGTTALSCDMLLEGRQQGRAKTLKHLLNQNQPWVQAYADHCLKLIDLIRSDLKTAYADRMEAIHVRWDDKRTPGRNTLARMIFNLNAEYADAMTSLQALSLCYHELPKAHQSLAEGLTGPQKPRQALAQLAAHADRIARLTRELEKSR